MAGWIRTSPRCNTAPDSAAGPLFSDDPDAPGGHQTRKQVADETWPVLTHARTIPANLM
jgi:hypothetical protein